jgi:hypothetical protein
MDFAGADFSGLTPGRLLGGYGQANPTPGADQGIARLQTQHILVAME